MIYVLTHRQSFILNQYVAYFGHKFKKYLRIGLILDPSLYLSLLLPSNINCVPTYVLVSSCDAAVVRNSLGNAIYRSERYIVLITNTLAGRCSAP